MRYAVNCILDVMLSSRSVGTLNLAVGNMYSNSLKAIRDDESNNLYRFNTILLNTFNGLRYFFTSCVLPPITRMLGLL